MGTVFKKMNIIPSIKLAFVDKDVIKETYLKKLTLFDAVNNDADIVIGLVLAL